MADQLAVFRTTQVKQHLSLELVSAKLHTTHMVSTVSARFGLKRVGPTWTFLCFSLTSLEVEAPRPKTKIRRYRDLGRAEDTLFIGKPRDLVSPARCKLRSLAG